MIFICLTHPYSLYVITGIPDRFKAGSDSQSKSAAKELRASIKKLMFDEDEKIPLPIVDDQPRFCKVMSAFHNYEKMVGTAGVS